MREILTTLLCLAALASTALADEPKRVDFSRDVRPILARHCFKCHGPDDAGRQAQLRLDARDAALRPAESGAVAIVPGKPADSELMRRVSTDDADEVMPPPATKNPLTAAEREILRQWIADGAEYKPHWAFVAPRQAELPAVVRKDWPRTAIDRFVLARLEQEGLAPAPRADKYTLARRVFLDLVGLPPTPAEVDAFVNDAAPDAYEKLVDRLLASPHYGERWARRWLDLARYADTNGYEKDRARSIWPYRDWVIGALNADMPFDRFTIEQLAGDMLPDATLEQRIATGFHRNTMLNEEGGIDPLEFRFYAIVDRVSTTATTWLGLTMGCAQCHTHKYDPIPHAEYYRFMALLDNADEPTIDVPQADVTARRGEMAAQIAALEARLPERFKVEDRRYQMPRPQSVVSSGGAAVEQLEDGSSRFAGPAPEADTYTLVIDTNLTDVTALRLEAMADPTLPSGGPGRTPHGNFVLGEFEASIAPLDGSGEEKRLKFVAAEADFSQEGYPVAAALDDNPATGWAVQGPGTWNVTRTATFTLSEPAGIAAGGRWTIRLRQQFGSGHTLGRVRVALVQPVRDAETRRPDALAQGFAHWLHDAREQAAEWTVLRPASAVANLPLLTVLDDDSVIASGDQSKRQVYDLSFQGDLAGVTAVRLEVLPDDRLPRRGPGRVSYEGPFGDFFLSEFTATVAGQPAKFASATQSFAGGAGTAAKAIDGDPQSGWSIDGGQGKPHTAVFRFAEPLGKASDLAIQILCERYYAAGLGRFRVSVTRDPRELVAHGWTRELETLLLRPEEQYTAAERQQLMGYYLSVAPELADARAEIEKLRGAMPAQPTTLAFVERPANYPRPTFIHRRGEFLQPTDRVEPDVLSVLPPLPADAAHNRLTLARWLVDGRNPLVGRVTVNRLWQALFGRGLVRTSEDFGYQGELPSHPELLDWLAVEVVNQHWSLKQMLRMIVTSATYQQASAMTPELVERDPQNVLLARGPRFRLEAELVRDMALRTSGLLSEKIGGPSVFPPQPPGVSSEGTYGPLAWTASTGEDRYRRGLYTFAKRTAPYAMTAAFDGPSGEACLARRETSNTPLQALTLLNDAVLIEAAQALGRSIADGQGSDRERAILLFRRVVARPPSERETELMLKFLDLQRARLADGKLKGAEIAGGGEGDVAARAAWTLVARGVLNLDEAVTKE
ncbi:MAG TPA: PSD1 and planctomycete cytochrome C domain-containing protein [Pirellulales bacterium]|nr:PSD1 and planctomycete cytochrome C domain-containing protein [Pirellulales bacterium]